MLTEFNDFVADFKITLAHQYFLHHFFATRRHMLCSDTAKAMSTATKKNHPRSGATIVDEDRTGKDFCLKSAPVGQIGGFRNGGLSCSPKIGQ